MLESDPEQEEHLAKEGSVQALFSPRFFLENGTVALSLLFGN
jgi:hypothetical protein